MNEDETLHCGIVYRRSGELQYLHLAWEDRLRNEAAPREALVAFSAFSHQNQRVVARLCHKLAQRYAEKGASFPWGYGFSGAAVFDAQGEWVGEPTALTCATFILAVFASVQFTLVALGTWPPRLDDATWAATTAARLPAAARAREFPRAGRGARVRPEESAVAATSPEAVLPAAFSTIDEESATLRVSTIVHDRMRILASVRARFGADLEAAFAAGTLVEVLRRGLHHIPDPVTVEWARELKRDPSPLRRDAILDELAIQLLQRLPPDAVSDEDVARIKENPGLLADVQHELRARAGLRDDSSLFELVDYYIARDA